MRTLLQKLKPEIRERLNLSFKDFPNSCASIERSLNYNTSIITLTINEACTLLSMTTNELMTFGNVERLFEEK